MYTRYRVVGEYGIQAGDYYVYYCRAASPENARKRAIREFKKTGRWYLIGEHNVSVSEA